LCRIADEVEVFFNCGEFPLDEYSPAAEICGIAKCPPTDAFCPRLCAPGHGSCANATDGYPPTLGPPTVVEDRAACEAICDFLGPGKCAAYSFCDAAACNLGACELYPPPISLYTKCNGYPGNTCYIRPRPKTQEKPRIKTLPQQLGGSASEITLGLPAGGPGGGSSWPAAQVARAKATLAKMGEDDKLALTYGWNKPPAGCPHPGQGTIPPECEHWYVGNVLPNAKLGLPPINLEDGPQGVADGLANITGWPSQLTVAMAWDPSLMQEWGAAMGAEQKLKGTNVMLGPDVNLARVPWSGRVFETNGEDPFLSAALVGPQIRGIQSNNISACVKHFIFNNHECNRESFSANVPERVGRELYAPGFFAAVDAGVGSVMCAFNRVNDSFSCQSESALQSLLKDDGGFKGWVVTDWGAQHDLLPSANGGLDQQMEWVQNANTTRYGQPGFASAAFRQALSNGSVPMSRLDDMALRILTPMFALGLVDDPPQPAHNTRTVTRSDANDALALKIAEESIVLLKNEEGLLPAGSSEPKSVLVFGDEVTVHGSGSGGVTMPFVSLISSSLKMLGHNASYSSITDPKQAAALARMADLVVVAVSVATGEGMDRKNLSLSGGRARVAFDQDALVTAIGAVAGKKTVVVARCSGAFAMPWLDSISSVLYQLMPGQAGGEAAAKAIVGAINPAGKLPISMPTSIDSTWLGTPLNPAQYPGVARHEEEPLARAQAAAAAAAAAAVAAAEPVSSGVSFINCHNSNKLYPNSTTEDYQRADYSVEGLHVGYR
jgi:beta-glucosidase